MKRIMGWEQYKQVNESNGHMLNESASVAKKLVQSWMDMDVYDPQDEEYDVEEFAMKNPKKNIALLNKTANDMIKKLNPGERNEFGGAWEIMMGEIEAKAKAKELIEAWMKMDVYEPGSEEEDIMEFVEEDGGNKDILENVFSDMLAKMSGGERNEYGAAWEIMMEEF